MSPLPNSRVVGPDWQSHHEPVVRGAMLSTIRYLRPDLTGTRALGDVRTEFAEPEELYEGVARVQAHDIGGRVEVRNTADMIQTKGAYRVSLPKSVEFDPLVRDLVLIIADPENPTLVGRTLAVVDFGRSTLSWEWYLGCDMHVPTVRGSL